jgi:hypothetical protein
VWPRKPSWLRRARRGKCRRQRGLWPMCQIVDWAAGSRNQNGVRKYEEKW